MKPLKLKPLPIRHRPTLFAAIGLVFLLGSATLLIPGGAGELARALFESGVLIIALALFWAAREI